MTENIDETLIEKYISGMGQIIFTKTHNRSVVGSINDQIYMTEHFIDKFIPTEDEINLIELNKENNRTPMVKLKAYPIDLLKKSLQEM